MAKRVLVLALALALFPAPTRAADAVPVLVIDGRGFGHGVGMAQDGAYWMGQAGSSTPQILGQFYPGTKLGKATGAVRVTVLPPQPTSDAVVGFPAGGEIRDAPQGQQSPGFPVRVAPGGQVTLHWDGSRYSVGGGAAATQSAPRLPGPITVQQVPTSEPPTTLPEPSTTTSTTAAPPSTTTTAPPPPPPAPPPAAPSGPSSSRTLWAVPNGNGVVSVPARSRQYRGLIEATASGSPTLRLVNQLDVETYLRGMGEVRNPSWPPAALRAQAIAARTYALRAMTRGGELCDDTRCQVYLGAQAEYPAMDKAVADTKAQTIFYGSSLASAVYSANGGGVEGTREEGFGTAPDDNSYPYLRPAPYLTKDPLPWTVKIAMADVAARLSYGGQLTDVQIAAVGQSHRVLQLTLLGSAGPKAVTGINAAAALGLKSTLFTLRSETDATAPAPPPVGDAGILQQLPDEAAAPALPAGPVTAGPLSIPDLPAAAAPAGRVPVTVEPRAAGRPVALTILAVLMMAAVVATAGVGVVARRVGLSVRSLRPF